MHGARPPRSLRVLVRLGAPRRLRRRSAGEAVAVGIHRSGVARRDPPAGFRSIRRAAARHAGRERDGRLSRREIAAVRPAARQRHELFAAGAGRGNQRGQRCIPVGVGPWPNARARLSPGHGRLDGARTHAVGDKSQPDGLRRLWHRRAEIRLERLSRRRRARQDGRRADQRPGPGVQGREGLRWPLDDGVRAARIQVA